MFRKTILKNGLRIISVPQRNSEAVTVLVLVGTGSKYERREISGISHFLEHMFFKGTKKRPDKLEIAETLDRVGGMYNAFTSQEYTGYWAKVSADYSEVALDWVSDIYLNSLLPEKEIEKEKGVIIEEINMYYDNPMSYVQILWDKLLYGDQPAGWSVLGTKESVSRISRQDLLAYMASQYGAKNTIVCLAGKISHSRALGLAKKYFAKIKDNRFMEKPEVRENQKRPGLLLKERKTDQTHFCLGVRAFNLFHPKRYAQEVLAAILGGMMSSRLFIEVREKLGLAYYIRTSVESNPDSGALVTQAGVDNKRAEKALSVILREYKKMKEKRIGPSELRKAKDHLKGNLTLGLETSDAKASFFAGQELLEKRIRPLKEIWREIDKVTSGQLQSLAREIFRPEKLNLAILGPFREKNKFEKLLKI